MQYKIVDQNQMRVENADNLIAFLESDSDNRAVLTQYTLWESSKGITTKNLPKSIEVLKRYPKQVVFLRDNLEIAIITSRPFSKVDLIDTKTTAMAQTLFNTIDSPTPVHAKINQEMDAFFAQATKNASELAAAIKDRIIDIPSEIVDIYKEWEKKKDQAHHWIRKEALNQSQAYASLNGLPFPYGEQRLDTFLYRAFLGYVIYCIRWKRNAIEPRSSDTVVNDIADLLNSAIATYFDGFISLDRGKKEEYPKIEYILSLGSKITSRG
jgi:hypothetical protein